MGRHPKEFRPDILADILNRGKTLTEAAVIVGMSEPTVRKILKENGYKKQWGRWGV